MVVATCVGRQVIGEEAVPFSGFGSTGMIDKTKLSAYRFRGGETFAHA
jgi:hypothetical protein